jgi:hypothetical protein
VLDLLAAATLVLCQTTDPADLRSARLADIEFLESTIRATHPEPLRKQARDEWAPKIAALREHAGELTEARFFFELSSLVALLQDGHTRLLPALDGDASLWYPIRFECFGDGIFVVAADQRYAALLGGRVVALGGRPIAEVLAAAAPAVPADNPVGAQTFLGRLLDAPCFHEALGLGTGGASRIAVERPGGERREMELARPDPGPPPFAGAWPSSWVRAESKPLLRDRDPERPYFLEWLEGEHVLYVRIRRIEQDEKEKIVPFCKRMLAAADGGAERLVLDLRENGGGNNYLIQPIVHAVLQCKLDEPGKLFVIIDGGTFSAAQNLASQLERETWALFVGAPTGSSPNHCGDAQRFTLPGSGFRLWCSTVRWQDSDPRDPRRWIYPDFPAPTKYADFAAGRDPALELARTCKPEKIEGYDSVLPVAHWQRATQKDVWPPAK